MSSEPIFPKLLPTPWQPSELEPPPPAAIGRPVVPALPAPLTPLIGRAGDVASACAILTSDNVRLPTLTGPGGVGKTRLAIRIGETCHAAFPDGVAFVPLAPIAAPELVLPTIARAIGARDSGERSLSEAVVSLLQECRHLLILDNLEHLQEVSPLLS